MQDLLYISEGMPTRAQEGHEEVDTLPNIVLVHGVWADGSSWSAVIERLQADGYTVIALETGDVRTKPIPGRPAKKGAALQAGLFSQLDAYPDATLAEHCQIWETTEASAGQFCYDEPCDPTSELDAYEKDGCRASEQKEEERAAWREQAQALDAGKLVFIDKCGSNIALTRLHARSPKGKRAYGAIPRNRRATITLLASLLQKANGRGAHLGGVCGCSRF